jgi:ADP-ribosyl-[dinitrogen reductase] hydrolase
MTMPTKSADDSLWLPRFRGALLGLATGDAIGTTVEFKTPGSFPPVTDMVGGGPFDLEAGQWTDDTSMALCLADSLLERDGFDPADQMRRYLRWYREGYLSSNGRCFDIGNTVAAALGRYERTGNPFSGSTDPKSAGNGSIMRLAPVALFYAHAPAEAIRRAAESSRTTHGAAEAVDACRYLAGLLVGAVRGVSKDDLLSRSWDEAPLAPAIAAIAAGSFKRKNPPQIKGTGYVVDSLEAALWALHRSASFEEGCLLAVNLGDDADTTAAVYGQLAGAIYGEDAIPSRWREKLALRPQIERFAEELCARASARLRPLPDSYWVKPGRLVAGEYPGAIHEAEARDKLRRLIAAGVTFFLDLTEEGELIPYDHLLQAEAAKLGRSVKHRRMPIPDVSVTDDAGMVAILDVLDRACASGEVVYVHCYGGIGRTGTVVGCHLARHGTPGEAALAQIAEWRRGTPDGDRESPQTREQWSMVQRWPADR